MTKALFINGNRSGYHPDQCSDTLSIGELIETLQEMAEEIGYDAPVYLRNDNGYTYGNFGYNNCNLGVFDNYRVRIAEDYEDICDIEEEFREEEEL